MSMIPTQNVLKTDVISSKTRNLIEGLIPEGSVIVPSTKSRRIMQISEVPLTKSIFNDFPSIIYGNDTFDRVYLHVAEEDE